MSPAKRRRPGRTLLVVLVVLVLLGVVVDRVGEAVAEDRLAAAATTEAARYDVRADATDAEIGGFGFLPQLARGEFSEITLTMDRPSVSGVTAQDLSAVMTGIQVPRELLTGDRTATVVIGRADLRLRMSPDALTKLTTASGELEGLSLRAVGERLQAGLSVRGVDVAATVRPQVRDGRIGLVVDELPGDPPAAVRRAVTALLARGVRLPELPFGATLTGVTVEGQSLVLTATATELALSAS